MSGLFSVDPNTVIVLACVIGAIQIAVHILKRAVDVWVDTAGRRDPIERLADSVRETPPYAGFDAPEVAPEKEPWWDGKAPHDSGVRHLFGLREQAVVVGGNPGKFDLTVFAATEGAISDTPPETAAETSGRHALTESMPAVVDDEKALAAVAAVSGQAGAP